MKTYYIYILSNFTRSTLYTGITSNLERRILEHSLKKNPKSFTNQYNITDLIYFEEYQSADEAIAREKQIKGWTRAKKDILIKTTNPELNNLWEKAPSTSPRSTQDNSL